jgi:hypothetical protein
MKVKDLTHLRVACVYALMDDNTLKASLHHSNNLLYAISRYDDKYSEGNANRDIHILELNVTGDLVPIKLAHYASVLKGSGWSIDNEVFIPKPTLKFTVRRDFRLESRGNYLAYVEVAFKRRSFVLGVFDNVDEAKFFMKNTDLGNVMFANNELTAFYRANYKHKVPKRKRSNSNPLANR